MRPRQGGWSLIEVVAAIVVVGIGVSLYVKVNKMSASGSGNNSRILVAGKMIEKHLEDMRITIARDTLRNWPPGNLSVAASPPHRISLVQRVSPAYSPKDGALVSNVVQVELVAQWTLPKRDSLKITTYVTKRF
jgi:prepilin-type N-terminal cleavage/methylation domain-containing protein